MFFSKWYLLLLLVIPGVASCASPSQPVETETSSEELVQVEAETVVEEGVPEIIEKEVQLGLGFLTSQGMLTNEGGRLFVDGVELQERVVVIDNVRYTTVQQEIPSNPTLNIEFPEAESVEVAQSASPFPFEEDLDTVLGFKIVGEITLLDSSQNQVTVRAGDEIIVFNSSDNTRIIGVATELSNTELRSYFEERGARVYPYQDGDFVRTGPGGAPGIFLRDGFTGFLIQIFI